MILYIVTNTFLEMSCRLDEKVGRRICRLIHVDDEKPDPTTTQEPGNVVVTSDFTIPPTIPTNAPPRDHQDLTTLKSADKASGGASRRRVDINIFLLLVCSLMHISMYMCFF